jgi:arylsulfatase A-like enzyme
VNGNVGSDELVEHVLFVIADEWRGDTLGHLGAPGVRTPNIDMLAAEGVSFTNHWCQASPCGPARSSLLTGTVTSTHGQWTNGTLADHGLDTLAAVARAGGVRPMLVGYTDTPYPAAAGAAPGDDLYDPAFEMVREFFWQLGFPGYRSYLEAQGYGPFDDSPGALYRPVGEPDADGLAPSRIAAEHSDVAWLTDGMIDAMTELCAPTLLHLNWLKPHPPLTAPAPYHRLVHPDEVALPSHPLGLDEQLEAHPFFDQVVRGRSMTEFVRERRSVETITELDERRMRATYYGLCAEVDHHLGRIVEQLKNQGIYDSTLIVFGSDHGDALGDHWLYGRSGPFDGHFRVPCVVRDPRRAADESRGTKVDDFTANIDLMPTILDALGLESPDTVEGESLEPFLRGTRPEAWRSHIRNMMDWTDDVRDHAGDGRLRFSSVRTSTHRYVSFVDSGLDPILYDLSEDPGETHNRAGDPAAAAVEAELADLA